jgi:hypothetical protein
MVPTANYVINYKGIQVKVSDGSMVTGKINILTFPRLSDMLKHSNDKFVTILSDEGEDCPKCVTIINKECIVWAKAED